MFDVHATEEEDKLVLLNALFRLDACSEELLLRFVVETELMNQFQFFLALSDLKTAGFVAEDTRIQGRLLELTDAGREAVQLFGGRIRASQQEKLQAHTAAWRRRIREELNMPAQWREVDGRYEVSLSVLENGEAFFHITVTAADRQQANRFCERWTSSASELYQTTMRLLGEARAQESVLPEEENEK